MMYAFMVEEGEAETNGRKHKMYWLKPLNFKPDNIHVAVDEYTFPKIYRKIERRLKGAKTGWITLNPRRFGIKVEEVELPPGIVYIVFLLGFMSCLTILSILSIFI